MPAYRLTLFCVANLQALPHEKQEVLSRVIRGQGSSDGSGDGDAAAEPCPCPLLLVSADAEAQHIVAQFALQRVTVVPLPDSALRAHGEGLCSRATVYASAAAGAGKSFAARRDARARRLRYVHVPLHRAMAAAELIGYAGALAERSDAEAAAEAHVEEQVQEQEQETEGYFYHLDVSDTCTPDCDPLLFGLAFFGGALDASSGAGTRNAPALRSCESLKWDSSAVDL